MRGLFLTLMKLYPAGYRELFADEMIAVFQDARRDWRAEGLAPYINFLVAELTGLLSGAAMAWADGLWRKRRISAILPFVTGAVVSFPLVRAFFYFGPHRLPPAPRLATQDDVFELLAVTAIAFLLIAGLSLAFILNMRMPARCRRKA